MPDSISDLSDDALIEAATRSCTAISRTPDLYPGVTEVQIDDLRAYCQIFGTDLNDHLAAQAAARSTNKTKEVSRRFVEDQLRNLRDAAIAAGTAEASIAMLGIPAPSAVAPPNATVPAAKVAANEHLRHIIEWTDAASPDNKRKPRGAVGAEIWLKLDGLPPNDEKDCTFMALDAYTPYLAEHAETNAGKIAHYMLRWRMEDGSVSQWGESASSEIKG